MNPPSYEFSKSQNELIGDLAHKMKVVSNFLIALGIVALIVGLLAARQNLNTGIAAILQGILQPFIGYWTGQAARSFHQITVTHDNDIENLMGALSELRKLYALQYWLILLGIASLLLLMLTVLITGAPGR